MPVCHLGIDRMNGEENFNAVTNLFSRGPGYWVTGKFLIQFPNYKDIVQ